MDVTPSAIAVDAGGSSTRAVVVSRDGNCGAVIRGGPGNPVADPDRAAATIAQVCAAASGASTQRPHLVVATVAGILSRDFPQLPPALAHQGLPSRVVMVSDLLGAYFSGTTAPEGSVLIVGTGAVAARVTGGRLSAVRDGLGWLLGDDGSGFWIGHQVARAVAADLDGRGPATTLTSRVLAGLDDVVRRSGLRTPDLAALLTWSQTRPPVELARFAVMAAGEAERDPVAASICGRAAEYALATLASLPGTEEGPVVMGGSVLGEGSPVGRQVYACLGARARRVSDGVAGAAMLAIRELGGSTDDASLARVVQALRG
ncbi:N-acetylglucosamine kinase [Tessaracoccus antarcticus]|uniref:N-acetylglucosamine kinase n=1 Tax=Tessaracoccus antarcticus TaxID=2479848 RepID=A0A3M0GEN3_9ACTN|nr:BadF/BadG/BcrA/BcrD ATPase family protein [Tessaracoccus antarcticus]RMB61122.1 N-acetylglucosamine kinase [Tessaracoccus antarcticus]